MRSAGIIGRRLVREESGLISAGTVIGIAIAVLLGYLLLAAFNGDSAAFGTAAVPGKAEVKLPKGDVDIYYAEGAAPGSGVPLIVPSDLEYSIFDAAGNPVVINPRSGDAKTTDTGLSQLIGEAQVPAEAVYTVESKSVETQQRITPALTFGQGAFPAIKDRFNGVVEAFKGPLGIAVVLLLVFLFLLPRIQAAIKRSGYS